MAKKVILTADSTCDLGEALKKRYNVEKFLPMHITYDNESYEDGINIRCGDVFDRFYKEGVLPHTAAISVGEYIDYFSPYVEAGAEVVHISIGSALSSSYSNACLAAEQLGGVYIVDSQSLSTGSGLLVIEAAELIEKGVNAAAAAEAVRSLVGKSHASFVLDTLKFMAAGGRCSTVAALGANILGIKPSIEVNNTAGGSMNVSKKYRGKLDKCVVDYVHDQLEKYGDSIRGERIFITHSDIDKSITDIIKAELKKSGKFKEIFDTDASCTISCHCGPSCVGILFMTK